MKLHIRHTWIPGIAAAIVAITSCTDASVDPKTARYTLGDETDTSTTFDLQKAYIEAGIVSPSGNSLADDFITFNHQTRYRVDTLADGSVTGISGLHIKATFGNPDDPKEPYKFYPLHELQVIVPELAAQTKGRPAETLELGQPDVSTGSGGLFAEFVADGVTTDLTTRADDSRNHGTVYITDVDPKQRTVGIFVQADLTNLQLPSTIQRRIVDRFVVNIALQLPY